MGPIQPTGASVPERRQGRCGPAFRTVLWTVYNFLRRLTANEADAADLTQQTFGVSGNDWTVLPNVRRFVVESTDAYHVYVIGGGSEWADGSAAE